MWSYLQKRYVQDSGALLHTLMQKIHLIEQNDMSIDEYYSAFDRLMGPLLSMVPQYTATECPSQKFIEKFFTYRFVMGLRVEFEAIRTRLLHGSANLTMAEALSDLLAEETRLLSMATSHVSAPHIVLAASQRFSGSKGTSFEPCKHCKKTTHHLDQCFTKYPEKYAEFCSRRAAYGRGPPKASVSTVVASVDAAQPSWVLDSGALFHVTSDHSQLASCMPVTYGASIQTADGTSCPITYKGSLCNSQFSISQKVPHHIIETARTLLIASFVPSHFWGEAVSTAVYLINRQPSTKLSNKCLDGVLFGTHPSYDHLRVFGCICYALLPPRERTKLSAQSVECVFLGYGSEHKGNHCYDPSSHRLRISRDVTFVENNPFFHNPSTSSSYSSLESTSFLTSNNNLSSQPSVSPIPISPPEPYVPPPLYQKPPITHVYTHRSTTPQPPPLTSPPASPVTSASDNTNNSDKLQVHLGYQVRDHTTMAPPDLYGFPCAGAAIFESSNYQEASGIPEWQLAMTEELAALDRMGTWDIVPLLSHVVPITCKWVFEVKTKYDGSIERYKA
jgi:hypothetical protein